MTALGTSHECLNYGIAQQLPVHSMEKAGQGLGRSVWAPRDLNIPETTPQLLCGFRAVLETPPGHQGDVGHTQGDAAFTTGSLAHT